MKIIIVLFSLVFAFSTLNAEQATKGFDNGMQYKSGTNVEFTFDGVQINIESANENDFSAKMLADEHSGNLFGYVWQIEGPEEANAKMVLTIEKRLLLKNELPDDLFVCRVHNGTGFLIPQEDIEIRETESSYIIKISNVNQFSIWGLFGDNPPVPTLSQWLVVAFLGLLAGVGGWFVWRRIV
jgi:hypothetical protein